MVHGCVIDTDDIVGSNWYRVLDYHPPWRSRGYVSKKCGRTRAWERKFHHRKVRRVLKKYMVIDLIDDPDPPNGKYEH